MCTILLEDETLPAKKRSRRDSQKAVDDLMERDRKLAAPFTKEELEKLFGRETDSISIAWHSREDRERRADYLLLTEEEKKIVDELGLTPEFPAEEVPETPVSGIAAEKRRRQMKAEVLFADSFSFRDECPGEIHVWLDNGNYCDTGEKGFYYVRYRNSILDGYTTAYAHPVLVVQKSKLRPDQIEFMERKCAATCADRRNGLGSC